MHIIPVNVIDNGNIMGTGFKTKNAVEAAVIVIGMIIVFKLFLAAVPFMIKTILFIVFALFPGAIALIGIGNESLSEAIRTYRAYKKTKDFLPYSMAELFPEEEKEKKTKNKSRRKAEEKPSKEEKKVRKEEKKRAKKAMKAKKRRKG